MECFELLFTNNLIENIVEQTNNYSMQNKVNFKTNSEEIKALIGILIVMGIVKIRSTDDYFSDHPLLNFTTVKNIISRDRLRKLLRYLHLNDNTKIKKKSDHGYDPLFKVRPVLDSLNESFSKNWNPFQELVVDEGMVACKSYKSGIRSYMPKKPVKWGYKLWKICDKKKYIFQYDVYCGKKGNNGQREFDLGPKVVKKMIEKLPTNSYHMFMDNFFSSLPLANELLEKNMHITATIKKKEEWVCHTLMSGRS